MLHKCICLSLSLAASSMDAVSPGPCLSVPQPAGETSAREMFQVGLTGALNEPPVPRGLLVLSVPSVSQRRRQPRHQGCPSLPPQSHRGLLSIRHPRETADWGLSTGFGSRDALQLPAPTGGREPRHASKRCWSRAQRCCSPSRPLAGHRAGSGGAAPRPPAEAKGWRPGCAGLTSAGVGTLRLCVLVAECKETPHKIPCVLLKMAEWL